MKSRPRSPMAAGGRRSRSSPWKAAITRSPSSNQAAASSRWCMPRSRTRWRPGSLSNLRFRRVVVAVVQLDGLALLLRPEIDHLDEHREAHREVDVALRDVHAE